ncbi:MAG: hypothetical protein ABIS09_00610 [Sphingomicrobium sp.]
MTIEVRIQDFGTVPGDAAYLKRRVVEEARAAAAASSIASTLIHVELARAFAQRCCDLTDRAWVAQHRIW